MSKTIEADTYIDLINDIKESQRVRKDEIVYKRDDISISPEGIQLTTGVVWDWKIKFPQYHKYQMIFNEAISNRVCVGIPDVEGTNCSYDFNAIDLMEYCASELAHKTHKIGYHICFWSGIAVAIIFGLVIKFMF